MMEVLKEKGVSGYFKFLSKKMLVNYDDGTFAWGVEGGFYNIKTEEPNSIIAPILRNIYYNDGKYFNIYSTIVQAIWIAIIMGCWCSAISALLEKNIDKERLVMLITLVGITVFELLFEARERYIYMYQFIL